MSVVYILLALLVFSLIVIVHEFGHFIVAKYNKVGVIEFSLGMGPRIISWGKTPSGRKVFFFKSTKYFEEHAEEHDDNTLYSVKLLPFGGSCMMVGEDEQVKDERSFSEKSVYARMAVIFAGPFFNFILAFVLALFVIGFAGYDKSAVTGVEEGYPMAEAGVQEGDVITEINGRNIMLRREINFYFQFHPIADSTPIDMTLERDGKEYEITVIPKLGKDAEGTERYMAGFTYDQPREKGGFLTTLKYALYEVKFWICTTVESLGQMIMGKVSAKDISGPVGIVQSVGNVVQQSLPDGISYVVLNLLNISILLTANLGVMNLLPIPALDGGRLLFLIIEWIRRKPLNPKFENYVNVAGFMLLMALMVFIMINDVLKLF